jgi:hypothetical protein
MALVSRSELALSSWSVPGYLDCTLAQVEPLDESNPNEKIRLEVCGLGLLKCVHAGCLDLSPSWLAPSILDQDVGLIPPYPAVHSDPNIRGAATMIINSLNIEGRGGDFMCFGNRVANPILLGLVASPRRNVLFLGGAHDDANR